MLGRVTYSSCQWPQVSFPLYLRTPPISSSKIQTRSPTSVPSNILLNSAANLSFHVHLCNKLASRHVRVGLAEPSKVSHCDICENAPGFFYCEIDGTSLCLQCDMIVHVRGKRTHGRYLILRQRVEFPEDKSGSGSADELGSQRVNLGEAKRESAHMSTPRVNENWVSADLRTDNNIESDGKMEIMFIDLNTRPQRADDQARINQERGDTNNNHESGSVVPDGYLQREPDK